LDFDFSEPVFREQVLTSIMFPPEFIDQMAEKYGIYANLSHLDSNLQVKTKFLNGFKDYFNMFDSRERYDVILRILESQIDF
jgi:hypothetical protein